MTTSAAYPQPGESVGPFRIVRPLGGGGMGVVYVAEQGDLGRAVALKIIVPHLGEDQEFRARFAREARALAALDSPLVVHLYDYGEDAGRLYLATQLLPDGDLRRLLTERGVPPTALAVDLIAQVAEGLADAHAVGLIHRDVKAANVFLRERDGTFSAFLGDFGIARAQGGDGETRTGHAVGTPASMAPELHHGHPASEASDVYGLGCLLWETVTGTAPYTGSTDFQVITAHLEAPVPQLAAEHPWAALLNPVLTRAMAKRPEDRYPSARAVADDLRRVAAGRPAAASALAAQQAVEEVAPAQPEAAPGRAPRRRGPALAVIAVALVLGLVAGGAWWWTHRDDAAPVTDPVRGDTTPAESPSGSRTARSPVADATYGAADVAHAEDSLRRALIAEGVLNPRQSACVAKQWIEEATLQRMVDEGLFDDRLDFTDQDISTLSVQMRTIMSTVTITCL